MGWTGRVLVLVRDKWERLGVTGRDWDGRGGYWGGLGRNWGGLGRDWGDWEAVLVVARSNWEALGWAGCVIWPR